MYHEEELQSVLERVGQHERVAQRRAIIYTLIPIIMAAVLIWYTSQRVATAVKLLNEANSLLETTNAQLADSEQQMSRLEDQRDEALQDVETLNAQTEQFQKEVEALRTEVESAKAEITDLQAQRDDLKAQVEFLTTQVEESKVLDNKLYKGDVLVVLKEMYEYPSQSQMLEAILLKQEEEVGWEAGSLGPVTFDSPGFAVYMLNQAGLLEGNPEDVHYDLPNILHETEMEAPQIGDVVFYRGGYTMFYFEDPSTGENFVIGMTTFGVIALNYDFAPIRGIGHVEYPP